MKRLNKLSKKIIVLLTLVMMLASVLVVTLNSNAKAADTLQNVALDKSVTASGSSGIFKPQYAVDGSYKARDRWAVNTNNEAMKWLKVDLGNTYTISRWVVAGMNSATDVDTSGWSQFYLYKYNLAVSTDNINWVTVSSVTNSGQSRTDLSFVATKARYVRLEITQGNKENNRWASVMEFEVYGVLNPKIQIKSGATVIPNGSTEISTALNTDFGQIDVDVAKTHTYTITNTGELDLIIPADAITVSGSSVTATLSSNRIAPGSSGNLNVTMQSGTIGQLDATISVTSNDTSNSPYRFDVSGDVISVPVISVEPYSNAPTNQDVTIRATVTDGTLNTTSLLFQSNGTQQFIATDAYGHTVQKSITVDFIDKVDPTVNILPYNTLPTNQNIEVQAQCPDGTLTQSSHTFTENGTFVFTAADAAGNTTSASVTITNIDKQEPSITVKPYNTLPTNKDVVVEAESFDGRLNVTSHAFSENGTFVFTAIDLAGNTTSASVTVTNIDKQDPYISINPYDTRPTNKDIVVEALCLDGTLNTSSHRFTENGTFEFTAADAAGNTTSASVTITNIDKVEPNITVLPYNTLPTNRNVFVEAQCLDGVLNATSFDFATNGTFVFTAEDAAGNTTSASVTITNIDKQDPHITIKPYNTRPTNKDVVVEAVCLDGQLNVTSHAFAENGTFVFTAIDPAGNTTSTAITITNIDKMEPTIFIVPYNTLPTNKDVVVVAACEDGILNTTSHSFSENGTFVFTAEDAAGNTTSASVTITNIDKQDPHITIKPYNTRPTNKNVIVEAECLDGRLNVMTHEFTENGTFVFTAEDAAGNTTSASITITNIDKMEPTINIKPYNILPTNKDVVVEAVCLDGRLNVTSHAFVENGTFVFTAEDAAGNTTSASVTITNIDKIEPTINIKPYNTLPTNKDVIVEAVCEDGTLNVTSHAFTENGTFVFTAMDAAGNTTRASVTIRNIDKLEPTINIKPYNTLPTNKDVIVEAVCLDGTLNTTSHAFAENGTFVFTAEDAAGNTTSASVTITNIDKIEPTISVKPYNTLPTNKDVVVEAACQDGRLNVTSHAFTENGTFVFTAEDAAGNTTSASVTITNIDKTEPTIFIAPYNTLPTNKDVVVEAVCEDGTLNVTSHVFTENGTFVFTAEDAAGNTTRASVTIRNIDKLEPTINIKPYNTLPTNKDVIVEAVCLDGTLNTTSHAFAENGTFVFTATDAAGNTTSASVTITNIDKIEPTINIKPYNTLPTNKDVIVEAVCEDGTLNTTSHAFAVNGTFVFTAEDAAGNTTSASITITNIDKVGPVITIAPYDTQPTYDAIIVTATISDGTLNTKSYLFESNGSFEFIATDAVGNVTNKRVTIDNIRPRPIVVPTEDIQDEENPLALELFKHNPYIIGYKDGSFKPDAFISRAEIATIFNRVLVLQTFDQDLMFKDVTSKHWAFTAIQNLVKSKLLNGYEDGTFKPAQTITRAELAEMIRNFVDSNKVVIRPKKSAYTDTATHWASSSVELFNALNIRFDDQKTLFLPDQKVTRAEAVYVINQFIKMPLKEKSAGQIFTDVTVGFWAAKQIEAATK